MKDTMVSTVVERESWREPGRVVRLARRLVERQLVGLRHGRLTVDGPFGTQTFGTSTELAAAITVVQPVAYLRVLTGGTLAAARSYVNGEWRTDDLTVVCRIFARNMDVANRLERGWARLSAPPLRFARWMLRNTRQGSLRNIEAHYDLGNEFFELFLDETLSYSCGIFDDVHTTLADASREKMDRICRKVDLQASDHLLEVGTGWGGLAIHAASRYGCRVTTATISRQQYELAARRVREAGLGDRVTVLLADYRDLTGVYDKLVSVEMIEAVGADFLETYFERCAARLAPGGRMAIQSITVPDDRYDEYLRSVDFIQQDVFPGSCLVSLGAMTAAAHANGLGVEDTEDLTPHYARTLCEWRLRFAERLDDVRRMGYSDEFIRRWLFYLCSCEAGFVERTTGLQQVVFTKPGAPPNGVRS